MQFATAYGEKPQVKTQNTEPSKTKQNLKDNADVNKIIKRYNKTGVLPNMNKLEQVYGEITSADLQESINKVEAAFEAFQEVPADIRAQFNNDAGLFIDYATNPQNIEQMVDWKLAVLPENYKNVDGTVNKDNDVNTGNEGNNQPNPLPGEAK